MCCSRVCAVPQETVFSKYKSQVTNAVFMTMTNVYAALVIGTLSALSGEMREAVRRRWRCCGVRVKG